MENIPLETKVGLWDGEDNHMYAVCNIVIDHDNKTIDISVQ
jgi:hypothetical protein